MKAGTPQHAARDGRQSPPGRGGGQRPGRTLWARVLGHGEDPASWGWPVARLRGVSVLLHPIVPIYVVLQLLWSLPPGRLGLVYVASLLGGLAAAVLVRELTRTLLAPSPVGRSVVWPLGTLDPAVIGGRRADTVAWLAGVALTVSAGGVSAALGVPLDTFDLRGLGFYPVLLETPAQLFAWAVCLAAGVLSLIHLLPMPPLDASRFVPERLRPRVGVGAAVALGAGALVFDAPPLIAVAGVGLWMSIRDVRNRRFLEAPGDDDWLAPAAEPLPDAEQIDELLAKVSREGLASLTDRERARLDRVASTEESGGERPLGDG
ncbi:MAG: DUF6576 domain-containing protein [Planctomycetota bacterium]